MFKIFKRLQKLESESDTRYRFMDFLGEANGLNETKLKALEDHLDIEFFHGDKSKPHYRKKRVVVKKLGRPRKNK